MHQLFLYPCIIHVQGIEFLFMGVTVFKDLQSTKIKQYNTLPEI